MAGPQEAARDAAVVVVVEPSALAVVVGASLGVTAVVATIMASLLPMGLARLGADPALASGPVATVVQDILSVGIYLMIATALLPV